MPKFKCKIPFYKDDVENVVKTKTIEADNEVDAKAEVDRMFWVRDREPYSCKSTLVLRSYLITCKLDE